MLMDLGPNVYQEDFERHFLREAAEFYQVLPPTAVPALQRLRSVTPGVCSMCAWTPAWFSGDGPVARLVAPNA